MRIYLDHNAGTALRPAVGAELVRLLADSSVGNPASVHRAGQSARRLLEAARASVARLLEAPARSVVFTSGGTEANNLAIIGGAGAAGPARQRVVTTAVEHSSVLAAFAELERRGFEVVILPVNHEGLIDLAMVSAALEEPTALISLGVANAETGTLQTLDGIASLAQRAGALLHLDAAQAAAHRRLAVAELECDLLTLSAHKLGGPAGMGALYIREGVKLSPAPVGGPQEFGIRAGTPNLIGAVGLGLAAEELLEAGDREHARVAALAATLHARLERAIPGLRLNGSPVSRIANTLNLTFPDVSGESLLIALDLAGVEVSMGSACAAGAVEPSHVLTAMGLDAAAARSSLRLSLGWNTTAAEVEAAAALIPAVWRRVVAAETAVDRDSAAREAAL